MPFQTGYVVCHNPLSNVLVVEVDEVVVVCPLMSKVENVVGVQTAAGDDVVVGVGVEVEVLISTTGVTGTTMDAVVVPFASGTMVVYTTLLVVCSQDVVVVVLEGRALDRV